MLTEENKEVEQPQQTAGACIWNPIRADKVKAIFTLFFKDPWKSECSLSRRAPKPKSQEDYTEAGMDEDLQVREQTICMHCFCLFQSIVLVLVAT